MFFKRNGYENPLHIAVINNDIESVKYLSQNPELVIEQNYLGYSPVELAQYLQRREILNIFELPRDKDIKVVMADETIVRHLTTHEFEKVFHLKYLDHLHFRSYSAFKSVLSECPLFKRFSPFSSESKELGRKLQIELTMGYTADVLIRWIDNTMGYGLFLETALEANAFVGEYAGLVRRLNRFRLDANEFCFHYPTRWCSWHYYVIDAMYEGNALRFINHSDFPNLRPVTIVDRGLVHVALMTNRKIEKGEQLTFDYGKDYWKRRQKAAEH